MPPYVTQERGVTVHVSNRHVSFRRILNFIHLVRALLDRDAVPLSQYLSQLGLFPFENLWNPAISLCPVFIVILSPVRAAYRPLHEVVHNKTPGIIAK